MATRKKKRQLPPWLSGVTVTSTPTVLPTEDKSKPDENCLTKKKQKVETNDNSLPDDEMKLSSPFPKDTDVKNSEKAKISIERLVELSYEEFKFSGSLIYSHNKDDCNIICEDIITSIGDIKEHYLGFDTEWPVTYQKGQQAPTALIQLCLDVNKCYLFHISCMYKLPIMLKKLIEKKNVKKVGLNVGYDLWKLEMDYDIKAKDIIQSSAVELRTLANKKLRSAENWSLEGLAKNVMHLRISKDPEIRTCDWSQFPLPEKQQRYAATDAIVSLMIHKKLTES